VPLEMQRPSDDDAVTGTTTRRKVRHKYDVPRLRTGTTKAYLYTAPMQSCTITTKAYSDLA